MSPMDIILRKVLRGHTDSVYAVDFDEKYIVSGSADNTIKVHMGESIDTYFMKLASELC